MTELTLEQQLLALQTENNRLRRINRTLMERVEGERMAGPYGAFEHSVLQAEQSLESQGALHEALSELKMGHQALKQANEQADMFQQLLVDAIESISDAFVLYDDQSRIMLYNQHFADLWRGSGVAIAVGFQMKNPQQLAWQHGVVVESDPDTRSFRFRNGRWKQVSERRTSMGGKVTLLTDVTTLINSETQRREAALEQRMLMLKGTLDNLAQGVIVVDAVGRIALWNQRFVELTCIEASRLENRPCIEQVSSSCGCDPLLLPSGSMAPTFTARCHQRMLEVQSHPMPGGGYVATYLDITERHQHAEELRESARWIRMITDQVPALIAYVDNRMHYSFTNQRYCQWYGWEVGSTVGKPISEVMGESQMRRLLPWVERALNGETVTFDTEDLSPEGEVRYLQRSYVPDYDLSGRPQGLFVLARDITERRRSAEALEEAYQTMEQRVHERTSALVTLNEQLQLEVDDRTRAEAAAGAARQEAERANLSKTKFLAAVSHDLLQPLNAARLFLSALADRELADESAVLVGSAATAMEDVESLISTLIDISKLDAGTVKPDIGSFRLAGLLDNIANEFHQIADAEGVSLHYRGLSDAVVNSDSQLLARMVRNLVTNAIRYSPGGKVLLACRRRQAGVEIQVWDTGMGIPQAQLEAIFHEFKRLPNSHRRDNSLGLGLAIVDKMAKVLGLEVRVRSIEGRGSMFSVQVPWGVLNQVPVQQPTVAPVGVERLRGAIIWVIDNDRSIREGMATLLSGWGCEVLTAGSREHLQMQTPVDAPVSLVIADYHLDNDVSGLDLVSWLNHQRDRPAPVLMITANHNPALKQSIRDRGYQLMHKPVKPLKLKTALLHLLSEAQDP